jgi:hypothetical protein
MYSAKSQADRRTRHLYGFIVVLHEGLKVETIGHRLEKTFCLAHERADIANVRRNYS